jgi:hypothetical protein
MKWSEKEKIKEKNEGTKEIKNERLKDGCKRGRRMERTERRKKL